MLGASINDFRPLRDRHITAVLGKGRMVMSNGDTCFEEILLQLDEKAVQICVNYDDDTLIFNLFDGQFQADEEYQDASDIIGGAGRYLGWAWAGETTRGYVEVLMLSFGGKSPEALTPHILFIAESGISVMSLRGI